ncbi:MAG: RhuM family protein, partial [Parvibaculales bacterium]
KIKDIYTTSIDYNPKDEKTIAFFQIVQNKLLWAVSQQTAAELIHRRVDAALPLMGMRSYDKTTPVRKRDTSIAKNYLNEDEIKLLGLLVEQYLAFAETMAQQHSPMHMKDWVQRLDAIIRLNERELLTHTGKISHEMAKERAELQYGKYQKQQKHIERKESLKELEADIKKLNREQDLSTRQAGEKNNRKAST